MGLHLNRDCEGGRGGGGGGGGGRRGGGGGGGGGGGEMEAYKQQFTYADLRGFHLQ